MSRAIRDQMTLMPLSCKIMRTSVKIDRFRHWYVPNFRGCEFDANVTIRVRKWMNFN